MIYWFARAQIAEVSMNALVLVKQNLRDAAHNQLM
jgi:hypothetical protein